MKKVSRVFIMFNLKSELLEEHYKKLVEKEGSKIPFDNMENNFLLYFFNILPENFEIRASWPSAPHCSNSWNYVIQNSHI